jgi:peptidoglycan hydrolase-like protein with peptidoglycan-binding domain
MSKISEIIKVAESYLGYKESPPNSNRTLFGKWHGLDGNPWCAMFVSYVYHESGVTELRKVDPTNLPGFAYCPNGVKYFRQQNRFNKTPRIGSLVFFDWGNDGISDHVGIVVDIQGENIITIEGNTSAGNQSNGGEVQKRTRKMRDIQGFGHPLLDESDHIKPVATKSNATTRSDRSSRPSWSGKFIRLSTPYQRNSEIQLWQRQMITKGYSLGVDGADGVFGPNSHKVLIQFQKKHGLVADGVIGLNTWQKSFE